MRKTIWKFDLGEIADRYVISMPKGAEVLTLQLQRKLPCIWVLVDPQAEKEDRVFEIFGTGHVIDYSEGAERKYIGTFLIYGDDLVFHLFERIK